MNKCLLRLSVSLTMLITVNAISQNNNQFYGGVGGGLGKAKIDDIKINEQLRNTGFTDTSVSDVNKDAAYKLFGGYQFNTYFGIEGGFFRLGQFGFKSITTPTGSLGGQTVMDGVNLDYVGTLPINNQLSILGRIGVDSVRARDRFTSSGAVFVSNANPQIRDANYKAGLGFSYKFNPSMSLRGELERYRVNDAIGNRGDIDVATLSLVFPFGGTPVQQPKVVERIVYEPSPVVVVTAPAPLPVERIVYQEVQVPVVVVPVAQRLHVSFNSDVLFGFDRSIISPQGKVELDKFSNELNGVEYDQVSIEGHTDRIGTNAYNDLLSLMRADAVKSYFVSLGSIPAQKITTVGKGSSQPITGVGACKALHSSVDAIACLQPDRRVEVDVTGVKVVIQN